MGPGGGAAPTPGGALLNESVGGSRSQMNTAR